MLTQKHLIVMSHLLLIFCIGNLYKCKMQVQKDVLRQKLGIHLVVGVPFPGREKLSMMKKGILCPYPILGALSTYQEVHKWVVGSLQYPEH